MRPPEHVRHRLAAERAAGTPFPVAWRKALRAIPTREPDRAEWLRVLRDTEDAWREAFEGVEGGSPRVDEEILAA
jgi:hypothetical protein